MKWFERICIVIFLTMVSLSVYSQSDSLKIDQLNKRVHELEEAENHRERVFESHKIDIKSSIEEQVKALQNNISLMGYIGLPGTLIAVLVALWAAYRFLKKYFEKRVSETVNRKWETLVSLIDNQDNDDRLREQKNILFLSTNSADNTAVRNLVTKLGFKKATFETIVSYINPKAVDLVVFNNKERQFPDSLMTQIVNGWPNNVHYIIYGPGQNQPLERTNFANSDFTLFNNTLVTLKYAEIINGTRP